MAALQAAQALDGHNRVRVVGGRVRDVDNPLARVAPARPAGSDRAGMFRERCGESGGGQRVDPEFVVPAARIHC
jgi:hypothetical protein